MRRWTPGTTMSPSSDMRWPYTRRSSATRDSPNRASPRSGRRRASSVPTAPTEPLQEVEGDGPAQSLQAQPSLSKKWKETGQLRPYSPSRASPRSGSLCGLWVDKACYYTPGTQMVFCLEQLWQETPNSFDPYISRSLSKSLLVT